MNHVIHDTTLALLQGIPLEQRKRVWQNPEQQNGLLHLRFAMTRNWRQKLILRSMYPKGTYCGIYKNVKKVELIKSKEEFWRMEIIKTKLRV